MTPDQRVTLLAAARTAVRAQLSDAQPSPPTPRDEALREPRGAFVSVHIAGELRGCIGVIEDGAPLIETVTRCAIAAATADPRFPPLTLEELEAATLEISVLSPPHSLADLSSLELGVHGIIVSRGPHRALLLPQVAIRHGFGPADFLDAACAKAGLCIGAWRDGEIKLEVFTAEVFAE